MKAAHRLALLSLCLLAPAWAHAVQDCELNGESVNPNHGGTTAGKTGIMRCKDRDSGQLVREQELQGGKFMGLVRYYKDGKLQRDYSVNERGNQHGRAREFAPGGQVLRDSTYDNGSQMGLARSFHANGQLQRIVFYGPREGGSIEQAYAEFNESGQLQALRCGRQTAAGGAGRRRPLVRFFGRRLAARAVQRQRPAQRAQQLPGRQAHTPRDAGRERQAGLPGRGLGRHAHRALLQQRRRQAARGAVAAGRQERPPGTRAEISPTAARRRATGAGRPANP